MQMDTVESRISSDGSGAKEGTETIATAKKAEEAAEKIDAEAIEKAKAREAKAEEERKERKAHREAKAKETRAKKAKAKEVEANRNTEANKKTEADKRIREEETEEAEEEVEVEVEGEEEAEEVFPTPSHFFRDFNWTPHTYDSKEFNAGCPRGGPGGLICCESCAAQYSNFLSGTTGDIEQQKAAKMGGEMTELLGFLSNAKKLLGQSVRVARRKPIPMPRVNLKALYDPSSQTSAEPEEKNDDVRDVAEV
jgi:chemotaxis protein histidine kinase CheA